MAPQYKDVEVVKFKEQNWLSRLQMVQFERPRVTIPNGVIRESPFTDVNFGDVEGLLQFFERRAAARARLLAAIGTGLHK